MSIRALNWAAGVLDRYDMPTIERLALLTLAQFHHDGTGECYPSHATLAQRLGCSVRRALTATTWLQEAGLIRAERRRVGNRQGSNSYTLFGQPRPHLRVNACSLSKAVSG